ncbi:related to growth hormone inducible transmembrane protein [Melanopsichium pennsylvanicum]|uniref:Related to growth hormone inducible transmembrane protein n=2 Tax=Melanopsichium pennsylvanicum TaxID=63383 RepID=A0AAJ4XSL1_9BASI|nr:related to growth hormone inducible transmembrane protein [Melanopsichium pennsylvanicum 4]SNX87087.1 related to growth hormone inducible transmembrane protein [Melanopsichium pennsylvanicum]
MLRPSFQTLQRGLHNSLLVARSSASTPLTASSAVAQPLRSFTSTANTAKSVLTSSSHSSTTPLRNVQQQVRGVRTSPFRPNGGSGSGSRFAFAAPHAAPAADAPTSISQPGGWTRALTSLGLIGGTAFAANMFFNRETRDSLHPLEAQYLHSTFMYLAGGLTLTGAAAVGLHRFGVSQRVMMANPWLVLGVGLVASIGGMIGATSLPPGHPMKVPSWLLFNASQAAVLSPLLFLNPAVLSRAALYTAGLVGSLCYVGATAKEDKFLWMGGPLLAGVTIVALSSLAPMILPRTAFRTLAATEALSLYGGLAVFGAFVLYDTQRILKHAQAVRAGYTQGDPLAESISLELDFINIFVRMVQILGMQQNRRK